MAFDTPLSLRNKIIYEVYVRNHSEGGTFKEIQKDLDRIKDLGTDIVWFMPIQLIGKKNKKGTLGCPYAIKNYKKVNPEYGTLEDFKALVDDIHAHGMLAMIDIVYNHTSPDSDLSIEHPEFFYRKADGSFGNKVGDWSDIIDLDYNNKQLWDEQIDVLKFWAKLGVDGFRCDVAPLVPLKFWLAAREEISKINKDTLWLAESVQPNFILDNRKNGFTALSDSEIYQTFDIAYDYDVYDDFKGYITGASGLKGYVEKLRMQEYIFPDNYIKLRFLENHDQDRIKKYIKDEELLEIWTAFIYFAKGTTLIYAGQEAMDENRPSLFDIDKVNWNGLKESYIDLLKKLGAIKKQDIFAKGFYDIHTIVDKDVIYADYEYKSTQMVGIFNVGKEEGEFKVNIKDGSYINKIDNSDIEIVNGKLKLNTKPLIFEVK